MCGIAGILYSDFARPVDCSVLAAMGDAIAHRGPDAEGFWIRPGIGLAHRRLSIIDLEGGDQPIGNEDGSSPGRLQRRDLQLPGAAPRARGPGAPIPDQSDTEVLVHLYEEHGAALVGTVARDVRLCPLGPAPAAISAGPRPSGPQAALHLSRHGKAGLRLGDQGDPGLPWRARAVDPAAVDDYLAYGMVPGARTIFQAIEKLPPAHVLAVRPGDSRRRRLVATGGCGSSRTPARPRRSGKRRSAPSSTRRRGCT